MAVEGGGDSFGFADVDSMDGPLSVVSPLLGSQVCERKLPAKQSREVLDLPRLHMVEERCVSRPLALGKGVGVGGKMGTKGRNLKVDDTVDGDGGGCSRFVMSYSEVSAWRYSGARGMDRGERVASPAPRVGSPSARSRHLSTIMERKPLAYRLTPFHDHSSSDSQSNDIPGDKAVGSTDLASRQGPGTMQVASSAQLLGELPTDSFIRRVDDKSPFGSWSRNKAFRTQSHINLPLRSYTPTGTPQTETHHLRNAKKRSSGESHKARSTTSTPAVIPEPSPHRSQHTPEPRDWSTACDFAASSLTIDGPSVRAEWIEDFLARKAEADRLEDEALCRKEKEEKGVWNLVRMDSLGKVTRRLSGQRGKADKSETTRERDMRSPPVACEKNGGVRRERLRTPSRSEAVSAARNREIVPREVDMTSLSTQPVELPIISSASLNPGSPAPHSPLFTGGGSLRRSLFSKVKLRYTDVSVPAPSAPQNGSGRKSVAVRVQRPVKDLLDNCEGLGGIMGKEWWMNGKEEKSENGGAMMGGKDRKDSGQDVEGLRERGYIV